MSIVGSETDRCRGRLRSFCNGSGLDLGSGGSNIKPSSIAVDLEQPYNNRVGTHPIHLTGDYRDLYWFNNGVLDYIFSSHTIEDWDRDEQVSILTEWLRVLKTDGVIILYLPDIAVYNEFCEEHGQVINPHHKILDFNLSWFIVNVVEELPVEVIHQVALIDDYSFEIVLKKL